MPGRIVMFGRSDSIHTIRWARGLVARGCELKVISLGGAPVDGIETVVIPRTSALDYFLKRSTARNEALAFRPDLVHVMAMGGFGLWSLATDIQPTVVTAMGTDVERARTCLARRTLVRRILKGAQAVTTASHDLADTTTEVMGLSDTSVEVIPFGVTTPSDLSPLPPRSPLRLCVAKHHYPVYGLDVLIEAMAEVVQHIPDAHLTIAGTGVLTEKLKQQVRSLDLSDHIAFPGVIEHERIYDFIRRHHLMVMPSRRESFGVAALEAGACGRPVIASRVGGIPEVVVDGVSGVLVTPDDPASLGEAIIELAGDRNRMARMGRDAHTHVRDNFDWEQSLDQMMALYERLGV